MNLPSFVVANLFRRKTRTLLTLASLAAGFLLFGLLQAVQLAFARGVDLSGDDRLITQGRYSFTEILPISYRAQIAAVPGVELVTHAQWFGGYYQKQSNFFPNFAVAPESYLDMYPEFLIAPDQRAAFIATRDGAIAGRSLAARFGWRIGERIPIMATIWPRTGGALDWSFQLVGLIEGRDETARSQEGMLLFHHDYFDEARQFAKGTTGIYITKIARPELADQVAAEIDKRFRNSPNETKTGPEKAFNQSFIKQIGDIGMMIAIVLSAVFFTLLLLTANTMSQAVRERTAELAILKTIGFGNGRILGMVLGEALLLCLLGALAGLALTAAIMPGLAAAVATWFPGLGLAAATWIEGLAIAALLAAAIGLPPAIAASRLTIVAALGRKIV